MKISLCVCLGAANSRNELDSSTAINGHLDGDSRDRSVQLLPEQHEVIYIMI